MRRHTAPRRHPEPLGSGLAPVEPGLAVLLAERTEGVLGTVDPSGRWRLESVRYLWSAEAGAVLIPATANAPAIADLRRDPRCALQIRGQGGWQSLMVEAEAEISAPAEVVGDPVTVALLPLYQRLAERLESDEQRFVEMVTAQRVLLTLAPTRVRGVPASADPPV